MLIERRHCVRRILRCGIGLICLCVVMFMLGSTMTLWTLQFALDQTDNPMLEGFSVPTALSNIVPVMPMIPSRDAPPLAKRDVNEHGLLRPPNPTA